MSKNKKTVTAPLSYDPGKGRPKEYLAYLNWQEMQALRRLNGNNMERGPMGLPSFPPDWKGSDTSTGNWSGAGGSTTGAGTGGGSDSGGSVGGTESGTTSSAASSAAAAAAASEQASSDAAAQQAAAQQSAAEAARNAAVREDAAKGGIASINVGPMQTPVQIGGGQVFGTLSQMAQQATAPSSYSTVGSTMPGGGGMGQLNARRGSSVTAVGTASGIDALGNVAQGSIYGTSPDQARRMDSLQSDMDRYKLSRQSFTKIQDRLPSYNYSEPIGPSAPNPSVVGDQNLAERLAEMNRLEAMPDWQFDENRYSWLKSPSDFYTPKPPSPSTAFNKYDALSAYKSPYGPELSAARGSLVEQQLLAENQPQVERSPTEQARINSLREQYSLYGEGLNTIPPPPSLDNLYRPSQFETEVAYTPYRPTAAAGTFTSPYNAASPITPEEQRKIDMQYQNMGLDDYAGFVAGPKSTAKLADVYASYGLTGTPAETELANVEEEYRATPGEGVYASKTIMRPGDLPYPTHPDGTPVTAEDIANMPYSVQSEILDKARFERMTDEDYSLTPEQKQRVAVARIVSAPTRNIVTKAILSGIGGIAGLAKNIPGGVGEAAATVERGAESLQDPAEALAEYLKLDPLEKAEFAKRAGKTPGTYGYGTTYAGGIPTQEPGGKGNDVGFTQFASPYTSSYTPDRVSSFGGDRLRRLYRRWDRGIGIPSPGDPDYNEYQEYLRERGTSASV